MRLQTEEQLSLLLDGDLGRARSRRRPPARRAREPAGFPRLRAVGGRSEALISSSSAEPASRAPTSPRASTVGLDVVDAVRLYLTIGGERNVAECLKFLADRLLLTGYGSEPPVERSRARRLPARRRERDDRRLAAARRSRAADRGDALLSRPPQQRQPRVRRRPGRRARRRGHECAGRSSRRACASARTASPAALQIVGDRADVLISTLSFALGDPAGRRRAVGARAPGRADHSGDHERHAARGVGSVAARSDRARHGDQRRHSRVRRPHRLGADVVQGPLRGGARPVCAARRSHRAHRRPGAQRSRGSAGCRVRTCASPSCSPTPGRRRRRSGNAVGLDAPASLLTLLRAMRRDGYAVDGVPADERRADVRPARARQLRRSASARSGAGAPVLAPPLCRRVRADAAGVAQADGGLVGHAGRSRRRAARSRRGGSTRRSRRRRPRGAEIADQGAVERRRGLSLRGDGDRAGARRAAAAARLRDESGRDLSHAGSAADAPLRGVLPLAGDAGGRRRMGRGRDRARRQARHARMAAGQGRRPLERVLPGRAARRHAADLSVHRQRSRRGQPGQAARRTR